MPKNIEAIVAYSVLKPGIPSSFDKTRVQRGIGIASGYVGCIASGYASCIASGNLIIIIIIIIIITITMITIIITIIIITITTIIIITIIIIISISCLPEAARLAAIAAAQGLAMALLHEGLGLQIVTLQEGSHRIAQRKA